MMERMVGVQWRQWIFGIFVVSALALTGCGEEEDLCADVTCDLGVCDSQTGQCANPEYCEIDTDCAAGYECDSDYTCAAATTCSDDSECDAGVCSDGVCVNPPSCDTNDDCVPRTYCGRDGTCRADPCNDVACPRGVCERGTDNCVSADSCTPRTEVADCVAGEKCSGGSCTPAENFCDTISCERGECSFEAGGCDNAADCEGDDDLCMQGFFCNDQDQCQPNLCEINEVDCAENGVCMPSAGECQNATPCQSNGECRSGHLCVDSECRLDSVACGDAGGDGGCPGNQLCDFDEASLTAECIEPEVCVSSFDCNGDRQCAGLSCLDPVSCRDDLLEPNDSADAATDFVALARKNTISGSVCSSDTDVFSFSSTELFDTSTRAKLVIELDVPERDRGLGQLEVVLEHADGAEIGSTSTGAYGAQSSARIETSFGVTDHGDYTVTVRGTDDLKETGVRYDLSINLLPGETVKACDEPVPMRINQRLSGTTEDAESSALGSSCTNAANPAKEVIYELTIDVPQEVTFELTPQLTSSNLSMSLRDRCLQAASERSCVDNAGDGEAETLTALLEAGTHYLVVQSPEGASGGAFQLIVDTINTFCSSADNHCSDADTANICTSDGGRFLTETCDAGCRPTTGRCFPPDGDTCVDAPVIDADGSHELNLVQYNDRYALSDNACLSAGSEAHTSGPDATYQVEVPAQTAVTADVFFDNEVEGALYLVEDCGQLDDSCVAGLAGSGEAREVLTYANQSDDDITLFLVVDTAEGQSFSTAQLDVYYEPVVCSPAQLRCDPNGGEFLEVCEAHGREWFEEDDCGGWGCESAACLRPNTCGDALDMTVDAAQSGGTGLAIGWDGGFSNDNSVPICGLWSWDVGGSDAYFSFDLGTDEILMASLVPNSSSEYPTLAVVSDCTQSEQTCQEADTSSAGAEVAYRADADETVYLIADSGSPGTTDTYSLQAEIVQAECTPSTYSASCNGTQLDRCVEPGFTSSDYYCSGPCTNGACEPQTNDVCNNAIAVSGGEIFLGDFSDLSADYNPSGTACPGMAWSQSGPDAAYEVTLQAGQTVDASMTSPTGEDLSIFIVTDCGDIENTCLTGQDSGNPEAVSYTASADETVYIIAGAYSSSTTSGTYELDVTITP